MLSENTADPSALHPMEYLEPLDDEAADLDVAGIGTIPPDALRIFCSFLLPKSGGPSRWKTATVRLAVLCHSLRVDDVGGMSLTRIAEELGVSRSLPSLLTCELRDFAQLDCRGGKTGTARQVYAERAKRVWDRRKGAVGDDSTEPPQASQRRSSRQGTASQG